MSRLLVALAVCLAAWMPLEATAATFGTVVPIGGQASDIVLDERRNFLYICDFTANRIDVMWLGNNSIVNRVAVAPHPNSISMSPDGRWLVITHYGNNADPTPSTNQVTLLDLANGPQQVFPLSDPPLGVAFGVDGKAFIVTTKQFLSFDPYFPKFDVIDTVENVAAKTLPQPAPNFPGDILAASLAVSGDGRIIFGMGSSSGTVTFRYDVLNHQVLPGGIVLASGTLGPRVVSINGDGSLAMAGWVEIDKFHTFLNFINQADNEFSVGTSVFDNRRAAVWVQIPITKGEAPVLQFRSWENFYLAEQYKLPENTTGKSLISSDASTMYSISDSGVMIFPIGNPGPRVAPAVRDLLFQPGFCDASLILKTLTITDPSGANTPFSIASASPGVTVSPSSGVTPATVTVAVNPGAFTAVGTTTVTLNISSDAAVNVIPSVRVLINRAEPDQRGTIVPISGTVSDVLADPVRDRYYLLQEDNNTVMVFDGSNNTLIATLMTYFTPRGMAITRDNKYLLIGHEQSQTMLMYDLDTFAAIGYLDTSAGNGNVIHSIATSNNAILATARDYVGKGHVLKIDLGLGQITQLDTLGVWENDISPDAVATASPDGAKIFVAGSDGKVYEYDATADTFTASRQDKSLGSLRGAYAAANTMFAADHTLLDPSLVPQISLSTANGSSSGLAFVGGGIVRTLATDASSPGIIERVNPANGVSSSITRLVEAPLLKTGLVSQSVFTRTLAALTNGKSYIALTTSGMTIIPWAFEATVVKPVVGAIVNAADGVTGPASGGLVQITGVNLSNTYMAQLQYPLATVLGNTCAVVNGTKIPLFYVSPNVINAQIPFGAVGASTMKIYTAAGISDNFNFSIAPAAPAIWSNGTAGDLTNLPLVYRTDNGQLVTGSNPIHHGDTILIYLSGMGQVSPPVPDGAATPSSPVSEVIATPRVDLGGVQANLIDASLLPGIPGVYQVKATVSNNTPIGLSIPLHVTQGTTTATVLVRVVN